MGQFRTDTESRVIELNARILRMMNTTNADLQANRSGKLSDNQKQLLRAYLDIKGIKYYRSNIVLIMMVWFIPLAFVVWQVAPQLEAIEAVSSPIFPYIIIGMFIGLNLLFFYAIYRSVRMTQDMQTNKVKVHNVAGKIKLGTMPTSGGAYGGILNMLERNAEKSDEPPVVVKVKGKEIIGESGAIRQALVEGEIYRVYYINPAGKYGMIVGAEAVHPSEAR